MAASPQDNTVVNDVHSAIIAVMAALGTLEKGNENKHDKYDYASIDDFLSFVRGHCHEAGIYIEQDELEAKLVDVAKRDGSPMAMWWARYAFTVRHIGGTHLGPVHRSVMVQAFGAQAAGSAQSYALKQFMRSIFLIPTGDDDDPDKERVDISTKGKTETDLQRTATRIRKEILAAQDLNELAEVWSKNAVDLDQLKRSSETAHQFLTSERDTREQTLKPKGSK